MGSLYLYGLYSVSQDELHSPASLAVSPTTPGSVRRGQPISGQGVWELGQVAVSAGCDWLMG